MQPCILLFFINPPLFMLLHSCLCLMPSHINSMALNEGHRQHRMCPRFCQYFMLNRGISNVSQTVAINSTFSHFKAFKRPLYECITLPNKKKNRYLPDGGPYILSWRCTNCSHSHQCLAHISARRSQDCKGSKSRLQLKQNQWNSYSTLHHKLILSFLCRTH